MIPWSGYGQLPFDNGWSAQSPGQIIPSVRWTLPVCLDSQSGGLRSRRPLRELELMAAQCCGENCLPETMQPVVCHSNSHCIALVTLHLVWSSGGLSHKCEGAIYSAQREVSESSDTSQSPQYVSVCAYRYLYIIKWNRNRVCILKFTLTKIPHNNNTN